MQQTRSKILTVCEMTTAKTQAEFARAWINEVDHLIGFYPATEDFEKFKEAQQIIREMIIKRAVSLDCPIGNMKEIMEKYFEDF